MTIRNRQKDFKPINNFFFKSLENEPNNSRNIFYLAQTCFCLKEYDESFRNYLLRTTLNSGFREEIFYSFIRCGDIIGIQRGNWYEALIYYMKAYEIDQRAEPLVKIAQYYMTREKWLISYSFLSIACKLEYPTNAMLFVDKNIYDYVWWHLLGAIAFYCGPTYKQEGKEACIKAINSMNKEIDNPTEPMQVVGKFIKSSEYKSVTPKHTPPSLPKALQKLVVKYTKAGKKKKK